MSLDLDVSSKVQVDQQINVQENGLALKEDKLPTIKSDLFNTINDQNIAKISVEGVKLLTKDNAPNTYKELVNLGKEDVDKVVNIIRIASDLERGYIVETIAWVLQLRSDKNIDRLISEGLVFRDDECKGSFVCRAFSEHKEVFKRVADRSFGDYLFENRSFTLFKLNSFISNLDTFQFSDEMIKSIEERSSKHFHFRSYSDYCEPVPGNYGKNHGLAISRGSREDGAAKIRSKKTVFYPDRYKKSDIFFIDKETGFLWISVQNTNRIDLEFYRSMISEVVTGKSDGFLEVSFNFSLLSSDHLTSALEKQFGKVEKILLREVRFVKELGKSKKGPYTTSKHSEDCLTNYKDFMDERRGISQFNFAKFHIFLEGGQKDEVIIKKNAVSTRNIISEKDMNTFLNHFSFMPKGYINA